MRYPGPNKHDRTLRVVLLVISLIFFGLSFIASQQKIASQTPAPVSHHPSPSPTLSADLTTNAQLILVDRLTGQPIGGRSAVFLVASDCPTDGPCPTSTPLVIITKDDGSLFINRTVIRQMPKIYVAGYKPDRQYTFLKPEEPDRLTVYEPAKDTKMSYDLTKEAAIIPLDPVIDQ